MTVLLKSLQLLGLTELFYYSNIMAKAKKEGEPNKNKRNLNKRLQIISKNQELIKKYENN